MKVKIICKNRYWDLEEAVNNFLIRECRSGNRVLDIKFSGGTYSPYSTESWSAMIIME